MATQNSPKMTRPSPFLEPGLLTSVDDLGIVLLSRDQFQPITLQESTGEVDGYAEGATLNTRFGSFPHSTLLNIPWGSQVRASAVDTGSRGRKRRREATDEDTPTTTEPDEPKQDVARPVKKAVAAASGFIHILRPTPELWTSSLPHRTQVVYTPDYSYVLQRIRAVPGTQIIEAGAGSGSFTHASARAVYNGYPKSDKDVKGKVFSFEFHEPRFQKMQEEIASHRLNGIVQITHRDVYNGGFLVDGKSPKATAIFLDLPAPWEALHHLSRRKPEKLSKQSKDEDSVDWVSPLDPKKSVHLCAFNPCIEQVTRAIEELRALGWTDIDMVEIAHRRLNTFREQLGANLPIERGNVQTPADVTEAVSRLKKINQKTQAFHRAQFLAANGGDSADTSEMDVDTPPPTSSSDKGKGKLNGKELVSEEDTKPWLHGRLYHRAETELKTHTSYLVFATLPREWSDEEEAAAAEKWPCGQEGNVIGSLDKKTRRKQTTEMLQAKKKQKKEKSNQDAQAMEVVVAEASKPQE
ncbi:S-adenosyl-L-methionine-dependent methyltransferase [Thelonectria olida]|uniref:tRNA (adenine(58)-N(1))-methyltransferase catalytic subunit TRM61 n=1 Tax=Thelonectria olida TaxID=1576542 RepID=A0A9P8W8H1_9HYPO|nr:S-adenosyl-L-methionine-dependent methyltransferase [Thelonectria olida]